jgi:hypothetical protein
MLSVAARARFIRLALTVHVSESGFNGQISFFSLTHPLFLQFSLSSSPSLAVSSHHGAPTLSSDHFFSFLLFLPLLFFLSLSYAFASPLTPTPRKFYLYPMPLLLL